MNTLNENPSNSPVLSKFEISPYVHFIDHNMVSGAWRKNNNFTVDYEIINFLR